MRRLAKASAADTDVAPRGDPSPTNDLPSRSRRRKSRPADRAGGLPDANDGQSSRVRGSMTRRRGPRQLSCDRAVLQPIPGTIGHGRY